MVPLPHAYLSNKGTLTAMTYHNVDLPSDESTSLLPQPAKSYKQQAFDIVEGNTKQGKWFNGFIMVLILLNVLLFFATTTKDFYHRHKWALEFFEFISVVVFTAEYALRVYIAPLKYEKMAHGMARTMFCCSFFGIIDLMGFLPYWLTIFFPEVCCVRLLWSIPQLLTLVSCESCVRYSVVHHSNAWVLKVAPICHLAWK